MELHITWAQIGISRRPTTSRHFLVRPVLLERDDELFDQNFRASGKRIHKWMRTTCIPDSAKRLCDNQTGAQRAIIVLIKPVLDAHRASLGRHAIAAAAVFTPGVCKFREL